MGSHRLVGQRRQNQQRRPYDQGKDTQVKKSGAGQVYFTQYRQRPVKAVAGEKRVANGN